MDDVGNAPIAHMVIRPIPVSASNRAEKDVSTTNTLTTSDPWAPPRHCQRGPRFPKQQKVQKQPDMDELILSGVAIAKMRGE